MSPYIWLGLGAVFLIIELCTLGLTTIWFMIGAIVAFIINMAGFGVVPQFIGFIIVSGLLLLAVRPLAASKINNKTTKTNVDGMIGKQALILEEVDNIKQTGSLKLGGTEWTVRSEGGSIIKKGTLVTVVKVEGVKLIVK